MIHIDLYRSAQAHPSNGPEMVAEWKFETWQEAYDWYKATGFKCESSSQGWGEDTMLQCLQAGAEGDDTYVGHEIPLMDSKGKYTFYGLSIEGNEASTSKTGEALDFNARCVVARDLIDTMIETVIHERSTGPNAKPDPHSDYLVGSLNMTRAFIESSRVHATSRVDPGD